MYIGALKVHEIEQKEAKGKTLFECQFRDMRQKKDGGGDYTAFIINGTLWEECPIEEGQTALIQGDLVNDYYEDKEGNNKVKAVLRGIKVLQVFNTVASEEIPF